jgi:hypothetical protein
MGDFLVGLAVGVPLTSSWKIVKMHGLLLHGACEVVVELDDTSNLHHYFIS